MVEGKICVGLDEFVRNAIKLPDNEFEKAMRQDNNDINVINFNDVKTAVLTKETIEAYGRL